MAPPDREPHDVPAAALARRPGRAAAAAATAALLLAALGAGRCGGRGGGGPGGGGAVPGIVLFCVDTLRADAADGSERARADMPALDAFARTATAFRDASSSCAWTAPAVATLLTGLEPSHDGVRGTYTLGALLPSVTTLAEALHERGWSTHAVTAGGWLVPERGYAQGFDGFETTFDKAGPEAAVNAWQAWRPKDRPFLLFLHTLAPHDPYGDKTPSEPDPERLVSLREEARRALAGVGPRAASLPPAAGAWLVERFLCDRDARRAVGDVVGMEEAPRLWDLLIQWLDGDGRGTPEMAALVPVVTRAYRAGLTVSDRVLARTLAALDACGLPEGTVVVLVGDHGEALGEHGTFSHARWLHEEVVRVPLLVRAPGRLAAGARVAGSCGLVDVTPTLLDLAGVPAPAGLDGRSLLPLARGAEAGHAIFAEEERRETNAGPPHIVNLRSARTTAAKYVLTFDPKAAGTEREELYDLATDPGERFPMPVDPEHVRRYGEPFCLAVARVREAVPALAHVPVCLPR